MIYGGHSCPHSTAATRDQAHQAGGCLVTNQLLADQLTPGELVGLRKNTTLLSPRRGAGGARGVAVVLVAGGVVLVAGGDGGWYAVVSMGCQMVLVNQCGVCWWCW